MKHSVERLYKGYAEMKLRPTILAPRWQIFQPLHAEYFYRAQRSQHGEYLGDLNK
jgi:hypothetical protein